MLINGWKYRNTGSFGVVDIVRKAVGEREMIDKWMKVIDKTLRLFDKEKKLVDISRHNTKVIDKP